MYAALRVPAARDTVLAVAAGVMLYGCSQSDDTASERKKLIGNYRLFVATNQPVARKDFESSVLKLSTDGTFIQDCRYTGGSTHLINGTWSFSKRNVQFSVFKDCAGVWPQGSDGPDIGASLIVEFTSPPTILLSPDINVWYERHK